MTNLQRENDEHQQRTCDKLGEKLASLWQEGLRVSTEDSRGGLLCRRDSSCATLIIVDCGNVVGINDATPDKSTKHLGSEVHRESPPWKLSEEAVAECDGRVEISPTVSRDV